MLTVHHLGLSQSDRIVWLCEELELPYTLVRYDRDPATRLAPAAYRALSPAGTAPVITDGDLVLGESAAIVDYLIGRHGGGRLAVPPDAPNYPDYLFWFHFANGTVMPAALVGLTVEILAGGAAGSPTVESLRGRLDRAYVLAEERLGQVPFLAGEAFTAADIMMLFPLTTLRRFAPRDMAPCPNIRAYLGRIGGRPALRRAMDKADPGVPLLLD